MSKYDDAAWHYEGDYPEDLPEINGTTHIGLFLAWCIENALVGEELLEDWQEEVEDVSNNVISGAELIMMMDGKFMSSDLNQLGNEFAAAYYDDDTDFTQKYASYAEDYLDAFEKQAVVNGTQLLSFYHVEDSLDSYQLIKPIITERFEQWQQYRNK